MAEISGSTVSIRILDKEYQVQCPPDQQDALLAAARDLDQRMREIRRSGNVIGLERIAVMAALNLA
jgi:cell division protein ZapA